MSKRQWLRVSAFALSDVGQVRSGNEDDYYTGTSVFAVADGMGGHAAGEVAARTALEPIEAVDGQVFTSADAADEALVEALRDANRQVVEKAEADPDLHGMGTTLTAGLLRDGRLHVAHVGDSRAYLLRADESMTQLTTDHTLVERLVREGRLSREEAALHPQRNVITRAIGNESDVVVDSLPAIRLEPGDQVLLCSDGLTGPLSDTEIAEVLLGTADGDEAVRTLVARANAAGGPDNITVVLLRVTGESDATGGVDEDHLRRIRTREDTDHGNWASTMGRFGAPQGVEHRPDATPEGTGGGRRILAVLLAIVLLAGLAAGGGWMLLSRAYFIGEHDGNVAIFRGLPQEVGSVPLSRVLEDEITDIPVEAFPEWRQELIRNGITTGTVNEARRRIDELESTLGDRDTADPDDGTGTEGSTGTTGGASSTGSTDDGDGG